MSETSNKVDIESSSSSWYSKNGKEYNKNYYIKNKQKMSEKIECKYCKKMVAKYNMASHKKTRIHTINEKLNSEHNIKRDSPLNAQELIAELKKNNLLVIDIGNVMTSNSVDAMP